MRSASKFTAVLLLLRAEAWKSGTGIGCLAHAATTSARISTTNEIDSYCCLSPFARGRHGNQVCLSQVERTSATASVAIVGDRHTNPGRVIFNVH